jgi:hypothetical protein
LKIEKVAMLHNLYKQSYGSCIFMLLSILPVVNAVCADKATHGQSEHSVAVLIGRYGQMSPSLQMQLIQVQGVIVRYVQPCTTTLLLQDGTGAVVCNSRLVTHNKRHFSYSACFLIKNSKKNMK